VELQRVLRELADAGVRTVAVEASSHALDQRRLDAVRFTAGVFTNLTRDHLDYHGTMEEYFASKARLVHLLGPAGFAIVNQDDRAWDALPMRGQRVTFGLRAQRSGARVHASFLASNPSYSPGGSSWALYADGASYDVDLPLLGDFNVMNAVGAAATAITLGQDPAAIAALLGTAPQVPGRLERIADSPVVLRDYAHTPDALERAIAAVRPFARGRLIVVFGCGGDRDAGKRPLMGAVAERLADHVILTSDNPRSEDPDRILDAIEAGMKQQSHERIEDRHEAIARAMQIAHPHDDLVLLAGKGHETWQIRGTQKLPFDEAVIVADLLADRVS
jgi:UDP-N-acetylmuramoyl-L-alanyl-D-glutamate--2,6-diaminopimelate ligase